MRIKLIILIVGALIGCGSLIIFIQHSTTAREEAAHQNAISSHNTPSDPIDLNPFDTHKNWGDSKK